jgi:hypothetical protein
MKRLLIVCIAGLMAASVLAEDAAARDGVRRQRIVIYPRDRYAPEPGTIYGYAPGNYLLGWNGVLYGPYPRRPVRLVFEPYY